jgi:hypothetical protein
LNSSKDGELKGRRLGCLIGLQGCLLRLNLS